MQTIKINRNGDVYSCDLDISKNEWLEILKSKGLSDACLQLDFILCVSMVFPCQNRG